MTEVSKEAVEALVKALSNVDETIELDIIDATAVAFELQKQGFTITRQPAMTDAELEREAKALCSALNVRDWNDASQTVHYMTKEAAMELANKCRGM